LKVKENHRFPFTADDVSCDFYRAIGFVLHGGTPDTRFLKGSY